MRRRDVIRKTGRHRPIRDVGESKQIAVDDFLPVDRQGRGEPRASIVERRPSCVEEQTIREDQRVLADPDRRMAPHERDVLRADPGEVELTRDERRQFDHGLVHDDHDQSLDLRSAQVGRKIAVAREYPTAVRLVGHETEGSVADHDASRKRSCGIVSNRCAGRIARSVNTNGRRRAIGVAA